MPKKRRVGRPRKKRQSKPKGMKKPRGAGVKLSSILSGIGGASLLGSFLQPEFSPVLAPVGAIGLGASKIAQSFGAGLKKKRGRPRKKR